MLVAAAALTLVAAQSPTPPSDPTTVVVASFNPAPSRETMRDDDRSVERGASAGLAAGRYRLQLRYTIAADVPVLGEVMSVTTTNAVVELDAAGVAHQHVCSIYTTSSPGSVKTEATTALIRGMPDTSYALHIENGKLVADMGAGALGYDPDRDPMLPASAQDARITDPDGDGVPGASMDVVMPGFGRFPINIVSRGHTKLEGVVAGGRATGHAIVTHAGERVLAGFLFANALPAQSVVPDPANTRFVLERLKDGATCNDVGR